MLGINKLCKVIACSVCAYLDAKGMEAENQFRISNSQRTIYNKKSFCDTKNRHMEQIDSILKERD